MNSIYRLDSPPLVARFGSALSWTLESLCAWTGHIRGCWLLNRSPLKRLWWWAEDHTVYAWRHGKGAFRPPTTSCSGVVDVEVTWTETLT